MATKNFVTLENLSLFKDLYDAKMAEAIATAEARSLHTVAISGHTLQFYREEEPVGGATPAYSITLPETDLSGLIPKITGATGGYIAQTKSDGTIEESDTAISDLATNAFVGSIPVGSEATTVIGYIDEQVESVDGAVDDLAEYVGEIPAGATATTVVGYAAEVADAVADDLDALDQSLSDVAKSGEADDVSYDNTTSGLTATDVQAAIDEVVAGLGTAAAADVATTAIQEESTDDGLVSAEQVAAFVAQEIAGLEGAMHFRGVITRQEGETDAQAIARVITDPEAGDVVCMSDTASEYVYDGTAWREVGDETQFVKKTTTIAGVDLQDNITKTELLTALNVADGAQVNVIESVKVNGSALTPDGNKAVNVTVAEGATNGTVAVNGSDVAVHGLGSAAYTASTAYDAAGSAATAKSEVIGESTDTSSANTIYGAKAYADASTASVSESDIRALFSSGE